MHRRRSLLQILQPSLILPSLLLLGLLGAIRLTMLLGHSGVNRVERSDGEESDDGRCVTEGADLGGGEGLDPGLEEVAEVGVVEDLGGGGGGIEAREEGGERGAELLVGFGLGDEGVGEVALLWICRVSALC